MQITTRFSIGDTVVPIAPRTETVSDPCPACEGAGTLALVRGGTVRCTAKGCYDGKVTRQEIHPWAVRADLSSTVGRVSAVQSCQEHAPDMLGALDIRYMLFSTGVGSGTMWRERDLFATDEEARSECARRNAAEAKVPA
jgi:hypothetical protein